jgi:hypothetical protein
MSKTTNKFSPEVRERTVLDNEGQHGSRWHPSLGTRLPARCLSWTAVKYDRGTRI